MSATDKACMWPLIEIDGSINRLCGRAEGLERLIDLNLCWQHIKLVNTRLERAIYNDPTMQRTAIRALTEINQAATVAVETQSMLRVLSRQVVAVRAKPSAAALVYFIERDDFIKIGTTTNLPRRLAGISKGSCMPEGMTVGPVKLLATTPGSTQTEQHLHKRFAAHRIPRTEWFYPAPELIDFINGLKSATRIPHG